MRDILTALDSDELTTSGELTLDELFYLKELKQRKIYLDEDIDQYNASRIVRHIMQFNSTDKKIEPVEREPIRLYISSNGGDVDAGFALIDAIMLSNTPVITVNIGYCYSMAFLILLAADQRYSFPNAKFLLHDGYEGDFSSSGKYLDRAEFSKKAEDRIRDYVLSRTEITYEQYELKKRVEWYMFSDEAKELGVIDGIVGADISFNEVV